MEDKFYWWCLWSYLDLSLNVTWCYLTTLCKREFIIYRWCRQFKRRSGWWWGSSHPRGLELREIPATRRCWTVGIEVSSSTTSSQLRSRMMKFLRKCVIVWSTMLSKATIVPCLCMGRQGQARPTRWMETTMMRVLCTDQSNYSDKKSWMTLTLKILRLKWVFLKSTMKKSGIFWVIPSKMWGRWQNKAFLLRISKKFSLKVRKISPNILKREIYQELPSQPIWMRHLLDLIPFWRWALKQSKR